MTQIPTRDAQFDRLEIKLDQVLDRLTRMEERQHAQGAKITAHEMQLQDQSQRLRHVELSHAVSAATGHQANKKLTGRWAAFAAVGLILLSTVGAYVARFIAP
jgi:hypothetical protein